MAFCQTRQTSLTKKHGIWCVGINSKSCIKDTFIYSIHLNYDDKKTRGVVRTQMNIYDGDILQK